MKFDKTKFLLDIRTLEEDADKLTTSDLQGCVQAITMEHFGMCDWTIDDYILQYIYGKVNEETLFEKIEQDVHLE